MWYLPPVFNDDLSDHLFEPIGQSARRLKYRLVAVGHRLPWIVDVFRQRLQQMTVGNAVPIAFFVVVPGFLGSTAERILSNANLLLDGDYDFGPGLIFQAFKKGHEIIRWGGQGGRLQR